MAGKKGGAVLLQTEVNNEDDWENLLKREGLIVVDVYSEWCGPCLGMVGNLKKLKLELGSDYLHLAIAKSDNIKVLERFRNKSEPTWMFIGGGQLVRVTFGANAPRLIRIITQELEKELKALKGDVQRSGIPFEEMTDEEQVRAKKLAEKLEAERLKEEREIAEQLEDLKVKTLTKLARKLSTHTITLYFPHMIDEERKTCNAAFKMLHQYDSIMLMVIDQQEVTIREDQLGDLFYNAEQKFPPKFLESITKRPCLVTLLLGLAGGDSDAVDDFLGVVEEKLSDLVYGPDKNPNKPAPNTPAEVFATKVGDELWPGLWTPINYLSKSAAIKILFPSVIRAIGFEDDKLPPPRFIMIFEATKAKEVDEIVQEFASEVLKLGFFDSVDPETAKHVCKGMSDIEKLLPEKLKTTKLILSVAKRTSDPLLALSQLGPLYISPDIKTGIKESDAFFPPDEEITSADIVYDEEEEVAAEEEEEGGDEEDDDEDGGFVMGDDAGTAEGVGEPQEGVAQETVAEEGAPQEGAPQEEEPRGSVPQLEGETKEGETTETDQGQEGSDPVAAEADATQATPPDATNGEDAAATATETGNQETEPVAEEPVPESS
ncbi:hypothetical protein LSTR_LSTR006189 [Laodelphax striatellus]|uniref:Thioredoxin domain-containing protein n=1 Tax=Laodelphax striatellus TaxID=195883 RepID=A0A482XQL3_LAOST|nr:hypothetical protein LSTR_LSTR006189 [Laodelphax striatellus]